MIVLLSPAKKLDLKQTINQDLYKFKKFSKPLFFSYTQKIVKKLKAFNHEELKNLLKVSNTLTELNIKRYHNFDLKFSISNTIPAGFLFKGDTYQGLEAHTLNLKDLDYFAKSIKILSGLYGLLRPYDGILPYRLEMSSDLAFDKYKNLYELWQPLLSKSLNESLNTQHHKNTQFVVCCASKEYTKAIDVKSLDYPFINTDFKQIDADNKAKTIGILAKKARGAFARFCIDHKIHSTDQLINFNYLDYSFNKSLSSKDNLVFTRKSIKS